MFACTAGGRYSTYGQLTGDLRRMLLNAIAYNKKHMDTDSTGLSKAVYDAAIFLQEKVSFVLLVLCYYHFAVSHCSCTTLHYCAVLCCTMLFSSYYPRHRSFLSLLSRILYWHSFPC